MHHVKPDVEEIPGGGIARVVMAAVNQPEYQPLWIAQVMNKEYLCNPGRDHNTALIEYRLDREEGWKLGHGVSLFLHLLTFGGALQPHILTIGKAHAEALYNIRLKSP